MAKQDTQPTQIGVRLGPAHIRQLMLLSGYFGGQTRAISTAIDRLFRSELAENPAFAEWVADNDAPETVAGTEE